MICRYILLYDHIIQLITERIHNMNLPARIYLAIILLAISNASVAVIPSDAIISNALSTANITTPITATTSQINIAAQSLVSAGATATEAATILSNLGVQIKTLKIAAAIPGSALASANISAVIISGISISTASVAAAGVAAARTVAQNNNDSASVSPKNEDGTPVSPE
jgi:ribosomal protein L12E/L44/L45/RPP1/RPP2